MISLNVFGVNYFVVKLLMIYEIEASTTNLQTLIFREPKSTFILKQTNRTSSKATNSNLLETMIYKIEASTSNSNEDSIIMPQFKDPR